MKVIINGEDESFAGKMSVIELLEVKEVQGSSVVVMVNGFIVRGDARISHVIDEGDRIEILRHVAGG